MFHHLASVLIDDLNCHPMAAHGYHEFIVRAHGSRGIELRYGVFQNLRVNRDRRLAALVRDLRTRTNWRIGAHRGFISRIPARVRSGKTLSSTLKRTEGGIKYRSPSRRLSAGTPISPNSPERVVRSNATCHMTARCTGCMLMARWKPGAGSRLEKVS